MGVSMPDLYACEEGWYCFSTLHKRERLAAVHLENAAGFPTFAPIIRYLKNTRRGKVTFQEAMFPGYVFVFCDLQAAYRRILATSGIRQLVRYGETVPTVPASFIESIRQQVDQAQHEADTESFEPGTEVIVAEGAFKDLQAVVSGAISGNERVRLLLEFLGRQVEVQLPRASLVKKDPPLLGKHLSEG